MHIACLAWGSLIWNPRDLPHMPPWLPDGPMAPVEFSRQAFDGRITLVLDSEAAPIRLYWAPMAPEELHSACVALAKRENIPPELASRYVGRWQAGDPAPRLIPSLPGWAREHAVDAAIWTNLPSQYTRDGDDLPSSGRPTIGWILDYLSRLDGPLRNRAEEYIRSAPAQTDTLNRRRIAEELGWHPRAHLSPADR